MTSADVDQAMLAATLRLQDHVILRRQALACGMTRDAVEHRIRPDGPWQRLIRGVYLAQTGAPTVSQMEMAALLHAGPEGLLTGPAALRALGISKADPVRFGVLVPMGRRPKSAAFVAIHRTPRMPERFVREGRRSHVLAPRALADAARSMTDLREVRALIAGAIQRGDCPLEALVHELSEGGRYRSVLLRQVLTEAGEGVRSVVEGEFRDLIKRAGLPLPIFNPRLCTADGTFIARPGAWWPDAGLAVEIDSREWHLKPADWERTMRRHDAMIRHGILPLHFSPAQIRREPATVAATVADALGAGRTRPALPIIARAA
jgi:hypothetical protein